MTYGQVAAKVRESKERHPEEFCPDSKCLWRLADLMKPCPKHMPKFEASQTLTEAIRHLRRTHMNCYSWTMTVSDEEAIDILSTAIVAK